jgi:hypothetical protein
MKSLDLAAELDPGLDPHELKCWIWIRIEANADPQHCLVDPPHCCRLHCLIMVTLYIKNYRTYFSLLTSYY